MVDDVPAPPPGTVVGGMDVEGAGGRMVEAVEAVEGIGLGTSARATDTPVTETVRKSPPANAARPGTERAKCGSRGSTSGMIRTLRMPWTSGVCPVPVSTSRSCATRRQGQAVSDTLDKNQLGGRPSKGLDSALVQSMLGRVRQEIGGVQSRIEALQGELLRLREQERLLNELGTTVVD
jgi:hypothetical protein